MTSLVERIERGMADCEDALIVQRLMAALAQMMSAWPAGAREVTAYRLAELALADALALRSAFDES
ncbi:MAG: hypothetical protein K6T33_06720 [Thermomonas hydrothermalis]|uniref:hypothetical protein n=1 Tax=Thermomonas hydrothermalis TaxID=213588 RepID=UPI0023562A88|nr:hypothetical protein [Thermomonas hydrothermalis]MCL6619468.1 hypothetical protein [Thermomonas hydrothermalis]